MILSSYERRDSPYVWLQFTDRTGKRICRKTTIRKDDPDKARKTAKALNRVEAEALAGEGAAPESGSWSWVASYLRTRYAARLATRKQYLIQWNWLHEFVERHEIHAPGELTREDCYAYLEWRQGQHKEKSGRTTKLNTALGELKLLGLVMKEAMTRGLAIENPASKLGIAKEDAAEKPAMNDAEIAQIYEGLKREPEWMQRAFHIALHTGLRHTETRILRSTVQLARKTIEIGNPKGGRKRAFAIPLYRSIEPMIREFLRSSAAVLWTLPPKELPGLRWMRFFRRLHLPHLCFHCTRTTFITRGALGDLAQRIAPVPEAVMMRLVNHAGREIHRIYQRFADADLQAYGATIHLPGPPAAGARGQSPRGKSGRR